MEVDPPATSTSIPSHGHGQNYCQDLMVSTSNGGSSGVGTSTSGSGGTLKRSNSAPMINVLVSAASSEVSPPTFQPLDSTRSRRFSSSSMNLQANSTPLKRPDRILQLRQEESQKIIVDRETQREKEVRSAIQISTSFNECNLDEYEPMLADQPTRRPRSLSESLHIFTSPNIIVGAPSPTRVGPGKQCFSPSMQAPVKNHTFTPSPSPSPTRKSFVRSSSPIIMRPSPLGKRKLEPDGDSRYESYMSPPKKFHTCSSTPDRMIPHPQAHSSVSSSSLEDTSPDQTVPRVHNMHEVRISSRPQPHMFGFMPLRDSQDMQTTDSENSDITESTDMSESTDTSSGMIHGTCSPGADTFTPVKQTHL